MNLLLFCLLIFLFVVLPLGVMGGIFGTGKGEPLFYGCGRRCNRSDEDAKAAKSPAASAFGANDQTIVFRPRHPLRCCAAGNLGGRPIGIQAKGQKARRIRPTPTFLKSLLPKGKK